MFYDIRTVVFAVIAIREFGDAVQLQVACCVLCDRILVQGSAGHEVVTSKPAGRREAVDEGLCHLVSCFVSAMPSLLESIQLYTMPTERLGVLLR